MSERPRNRRFQRKSTNSGSEAGSEGPSRRRSKGVRRHEGLSEPKKSGRTNRREGGAGLIWGLHAGRAALLNPRRTIHEIWMSEKTKSALDLPSGYSFPAVPTMLEPRRLDKILPPGASHQGLILKAAPLEWPDLDQIADAATKSGLILVLDQVTDPHNVGAMLRLASAFGADALVIQSRHAPPLSGALAKVAVGCLETVPICQVTNIANSLERLKSAGWFVTGLAGEAKLGIARALSGGGKTVLVMGAEGPGLRPRVAKVCDQLAYIPMQSGGEAGEAESLNVATAAAIALYEARRQDC